MSNREKKRQEAPKDERFCGFDLGLRAEWGLVARIGFLALLDIKTVI